MAIATDRNAAVMNILRFSDLCAQGKAQGQRVFIRADLNVPLNDAGEITEDTRVRASVPAIEMALKAGAASTYQPQPMCSGRYTAIPTRMVPRMPRRQK